MKRIVGSVLGAVAVMGLFANRLYADAKVETTDVGLNGKAIGISVAPGLKHVALLAQQGSRYVVYFDGQAGPKIEAIDWTGGTPFNANSGAGWVGQIPVLFDDTGEHWTYCYKDSADTVIMLDGKELARGPMAPQLQMPLQFSRGGKYLAWAYNGLIYINGQAGPKSRALPHLFFSPDGSHYAYADDEEGGPPQWGVVDGKQVNYFGEIDSFSATNHLLSVVHDPSGQAAVLVMDGKPQFKAANIQKIWTSADGKQVAIMMTPAPNAKTVLSVNGKIVDGTEGVGVSNVFFSPDGKRYAAHCSASGGQFMIIDGKKGDNYNNIPEQVRPYDTQRMMWLDPSQAITPTWQNCPAFTSDSSKFVYLAAGAQNQSFLMTEDGEYDDFMSPIGFTNLDVSAAGGHYGFLGMAPNRKQAVVIDGKSTVLGPASVPQLTMSSLAFSPDGSHYGVVVGLGNSDLYVDGQKMAGGIMGMHFVFSPDGKHVLYLGRQNGVVIDGKVIATDVPTVNLSNPMFSPDGKHVYWTNTRRIDNTTDSQELYVDGKAVTHFVDIGLGHGPTFNDSFSADDVLTFITRTDGNLMKFVVTPDSSVDEMLASAKPAQ